jgi:chaperone modulatory protein CbpM
MTRDEKQTRVLAGTILEKEVVLSLSELCQATQVSAERVIELAHEGIVEPIGSGPESWRFRGVSLYRVRCAQRLKDDLGVNMPGAGNLSTRVNPT